MEAQSHSAGPASAAVVIDPGRAPADVVLGAVDAALRSDLDGVAVCVAIGDDDPRAGVLRALCAADARVEVGPGAPQAGLVFQMPARARPGPRTLSALAEALRDGDLGSVEVPLPGRYPALAGLGSRRKLRARGAGSGTKTLRAAEVGLRSHAVRTAPPPPPKGDLATERAEHLRHRARSATMRARMDRHAHRLSRERLQTRHERARLRHAEQRLAATGPGQWVRWRARNVARRASGIPGAASSALGSARSFARRARRYAVDRRRSRKLEE